MNLSASRARRNSKTIGVTEEKRFHITSFRPHIVIALTNVLIENATTTTFIFYFLRNIGMHGPFELFSSLHRKFLC
jgi:hypothetical protein